MKNIINYLYIFLILFASEFIFSDELEEVIVVADYRQTDLSKEDSSVFILDQDDIKSEPIKHFENLSYLIPNLNFAASDSRARYFQIRGIGERSGYLGTPNSSVAFLIDDVDYSGQGGIATTFDVEQIEVYRGPQGARIGAYALAGLIYFYPVVKYSQTKLYCENIAKNYFLDNKNTKRLTKSSLECYLLIFVMVVMR